MATQGDTTLDKELQTRIETYILLHAKTLNISLDTLEWEAACAPPPAAEGQPTAPVYKLHVAINGEPHVLTFTAEEVHALAPPEDHGAEAWPRLTEKIDQFLGAFAPKKSHNGLFGFEEPYCS